MYSGVVHITFALFAKAFREDFLPTDCGIKLQASAPPCKLWGGGGLREMQEGRGQQRQFSAVPAVE
jgi:hypothetical protein